MKTRKLHLNTLNLFRYFELTENERSTQTILGLREMQRRTCEFIIESFMQLGKMIATLPNTGFFFYLQAVR